MEIQLAAIWGVVANVGAIISLSTLLLYFIWRHKRDRVIGLIQAIFVTVTVTAAAFLAGGQVIFGALWAIFVITVAVLNWGYSNKEW